MNLNQKEVEIKKSLLHASSSYELDLLKRDNAMLIPLEIKQVDNSSYHFIFDVEDLTCLNENKLNILEKYGLLLEALKLYPIYLNYKVDLSPENLYIDYSLNLKVAMRDICGKEELHSEELFINEYLCLLGGLLSSKYNYQKFKDSGLDLLQKSKITSKFAKLTTIIEMKECLIKEITETREKQEKTLTLVNKNEYRGTKVICVILGVLTILLGAIAGYYYSYQNSYLQEVNKGYESFIALDYVKTEDTFASTDIKRMSITTKYVIATAYIKTDGLTNDQKNNILSGVTLSSNEQILNFWVYLAKGETEQAIDVAKLLDSEEYLVYGYMKQKDAVMKDTSLSGEEREMKLQEIESKLKPYADAQKKQEGTGN